MTQMLFYENPKPLSPALHTGLSIKQDRARFKFAERVNSVLCAGVEFAEMAFEYPIVFVEGSDGWVPIVLFGLDATENQWVDNSGAWRGQYIPAFIRQYPFAIGRGESEAPLVCIDEGSDLISKGEGYPLFEDGQPTPFVKQTADFLKEFHQQMERTKVFAQSLDQLGLLSEVKATTGQAGSSAMSLGKARVVDERQLLALADADALSIFRKGELAWVYAHLLSLGHLKRMIAARQSRSS